MPAVTKLGPAGAPAAVRPYIPRTWYVAPAGAGAGNLDGTEEADAWDSHASIVWGFGGVFDGDELFVLDQHNARIDVVRGSATPGTPVRIRLDHPTRPGVVDGGTVRQNALNLNGQPDVRVTGGTYRNCLGDAVLSGAGTPCDRLELDGLAAADNGGAGIDIEGASMVLRNLDIDRCADGGIDATFAPDILIEDVAVDACGTTGANNHDGVLVGGGSPRALIQRVTVTNQKGTTGAGIDLTGTASNPTGGTIKQCLVRDGEGIGISYSAPEAHVDNDAQIESCIAEGNRQNFTVKTNGTCRWYHLTGHDSTGENARVGVSGGLWAGALTVRNCIFDGGTHALGWHPDVGGTIDSDHTSYFGGTTALFNDDGADRNLAGWRLAHPGNDLNSIDGDPLISVADLFNITGGSPAERTGVSGLGVTADYTGVAFSTPPNMGAYAVAVSAAPTSEGLEWTLKVMRMHYNLRTARMHYLLERARMHYQVDEDD